LGLIVADSHKKPETILRIISEVNEAISVSNGHRNVLTTILDAISEQFRVPCCWVQRINPADQRLYLASHRGFTRTMIWELDSSDSGWHLNDLVSRYGHKVVIPNLSDQSEINLKSFCMAGYRSLVTVPITTYRISGILGMASRREKQFGQDTAQLLAVVAGMAGTALEKAELLERASHNGRNDRETAQKELRRSTPLPSQQSPNNPEAARLPSEREASPEKPVTKRHITENDRALQYEKIKEIIDRLEKMSYH
jgi:GAF domain-containing protein